MIFNEKIEMRKIAEHLGGCTYKITHILFATKPGTNLTLSYSTFIHWFGIQMILFLYSLLFMKIWENKENLRTVKGLCLQNVFYCPLLQRTKFGTKYMLRYNHFT